MRIMSFDPQAGSSKRLGKRPSEVSVSEERVLRRRFRNGLPLEFRFCQIVVAYDFVG
jgi:hypothetical protein